MEELRQTQMSLFVVAVAALREREAHSLQVRRLQVSAARRASTVAGEVGGQLAMVSWRGDRLAAAVEELSCAECRPALGPLVAAYRAQASAAPPGGAGRWLPVRGWVS